MSPGCGKQMNNDFLLLVNLTIIAVMVTIATKVVAIFKTLFSPTVASPKRGVVPGSPRDFVWGLGKPSRLGGSYM